MILQILRHMWRRVQVGWVNGASLAETGTATIAVHSNVVMSLLAETWEPMPEMWKGKEKSRGRCCRLSAPETTSPSVSQTPSPDGLPTPSPEVPHTPTSAYQLPTMPTLPVGQAIKNTLRELLMPLPTNEHWECMSQLLQVRTPDFERTANIM
jgi:hypothetical protein